MLYVEQRNRSGCLKEKKDVQYIVYVMMYGRTGSMECFEFGGLALAVKEGERREREGEMTELPRKEKRHRSALFGKRLLASC